VVNNGESYTRIPYTLPRSVVPLSIPSLLFPNHRLQDAAPTATEDEPHPVPCRKKNPCQQNRPLDIVTREWIFSTETVCRCWYFSLKITDKPMFFQGRTLSTSYSSQSPSVRWVTPCDISLLLSQFACGILIVMKRSWGSSLRGFRVASQHTDRWGLACLNERDSCIAYFAVHDSIFFR